MPLSSEDLLVQLAIERGLVSEHDVAQARAKLGAAAEDPRLRLTDALIATGSVTELALARVWADELGLPLIDLVATPPEPEAIAQVPMALLRRHRLVPWAQRANGLVIVMADPLDQDALEHVRATATQPVEAAVGAPSAVDAAIARIDAGETKASTAPPRIAPMEVASERRGATSEADQREPAVAASDHVVVNLVQRVIEDAVHRGASDLHWEPLRHGFRVRYRIDGVLHEAERPPKPHQLAVISRLKLMAGISIAEKRLPQDGRTRLGVAGRTLDLRVSSLPTVHGESVVMRVLDQQSLKVGLAELGFWPEDEKAFRAALAVPDGIILVTGPTGSGKTTTLYSCLHHLNRPDRKIITVEDPIEYQLAGINQVPVRPEVGLTFASALRAILRQAPNVVMVGEIRDPETAQIAIHAALTGHLVFSTLHTNDAPGAIARLLDLGLAPYQVAGAVRAVLAQRLVRRVCRRCATARQARVQPGGAMTDSAGAGCPECRGTGYKGRLGIFELLEIDETLQQAIYERVGLSQIRNHVRARGWRTMRDDGFRKVRAGWTTLAEVTAATSDEQSS